VPAGNASAAQLGLNEARAQHGHEDGTTSQSN